MIPLRFKSLAADLLHLTEFYNPDQHGGMPSGDHATYKLVRAELTTALRRDADDLVERAKAFAKERHGMVGQVRKYTAVPYWTHPAEVATILESLYFHEDAPDYVLAAAWMHDLLEDTRTTEEEIRKRFGDVVADLVVELTEPTFPGNRAARKMLEAERLSKVSRDAKIIKLADTISNTSTIVAFDKKFAKTYLSEKVHLLSVMIVTDAAGKKIPLQITAEHIVAQATKILDS